MTIVIQIGNSDNKLSQGEWAHFCAGAHLAISENVHQIHFKGGSDWDAPWQNACWACELGNNSLDDLKAGLAMLCRQFNQDSIAITCGETEFVTGDYKP
jgi:hypothetical protein